MSDKNKYDENTEESAVENLTISDSEIVDEEISVMRESSFIRKVLYNFDSMNKNEKFLSIFIAIVSIGFSLYHFYTAYFGTLPAWQHRALHVGIGLVLLFCIYPLRAKKGFQIIDFIFVLMSIAFVVYVLIEYPGQELRMGSPNSMDLIFGTILLLLVIEGVRRTNGLPMTILGLFFIVYIFIGPYLPGLFGHQGFRYTKLIDQMFNGTGGIFGTPIYVSSTVLILFVIWGQFLIKGGAGEFFTNFALSLTGKFRGGPALGAVLSSALVGSITGSGAANVVITGSFTIPLMKKVGYNSKFAGAVEAVASQGGQIMPPVMGAAAFIMAEYIGVPYIKLAMYAIIPALGYFLMAAVSIYIEARKNNLKGLSKEDLPDVKKVLFEGWYFFLPIILVIWMMATGKSPMRAGFWAIVLTFALSYINPKNRMSVVDVLECFEKGARSSISVLAACAAAGIIVGAISLSGLGIRFSRLAILIAGENVLLMLFMTMIASLILGMGMPTASAYIILAVLAAPSLINSGISPVSAHLFVFYFGVISGLTPPVAITAYTAAGLAGSDPTKTSTEAVKLALGGFLLPFMFCYNPELVLQGSSALTTAQVIFTSLLGCIAFAVAISGFLVTKLSYIERGLLIVGSLLLIERSFFTDILGLASFAVMLLLHVSRYKKFRKIQEV